MWTRGSSSLALSILLLLTSVVGMAGHDHAAGVERAGTECVVDHERAHGASPAPARPETSAAGERHQHHCLACRFSGQRISLASMLALAGPVSAERAAAAIRHEPRVSLPWTGRTLRGPPSA